MNKKEIVEQTKLAFDLLEKLYFESSYLIKEIEGILSQEEQNSSFPNLEDMELHQGVQIA